MIFDLSKLSDRKMTLSSWRQSAETRSRWRTGLLEEILVLRRQNLMTDLTFLCSDVSVPAHKLCLATFSVHLRDLLLDTGPDPATVAVPDMTGDQVGWVTVDSDNSDIENILRWPCFWTLFTLVSCPRASTSCAP